jgi:hypothetical protein
MKMVVKQSNRRKTASILVYLQSPYSDIMTYCTQVAHLRTDSLRSFELGYLISYI